MIQNSAESMLTTLKRSTDYKNICVVGLGYVGLPTALLYASKGFNVTGVDTNSQVIDDIESCRIPAMFPSLSKWCSEAQQNETLVLSNTPQPADVFIITVPTPWDQSTHTCDLSSVKAAVESVVKVLEPGNLVILESTVPVGTTRNIVRPILEATGFVVGQDIYLAFLPERVLPGNVVQELLHNDRVVGGTTQEAGFLARNVLARVIEGEIYVTDDVTAEFCKLAENTYRDVNIALANELSLVANKIGVNIHEALPIINQHPRVNMHQPGIGVGGHCIAVDPWFLVEAAPDETPLIQTARAVNDRMPSVTVEKIKTLVSDVSNPKIVIAGLTYKPNVGDTRESPALHIVELLREQKLNVVPYDPLLSEYQHLSLIDLLDGADLLAVLVNHNCFEEDLIHNRHALLERMRHPRIQMF